MHSLDIPSIFRRVQCDSGGTKLIGLNIFDFSQPFVPFFTDKVIEYAKNAITV